MVSETEPSYGDDTDFPPIDQEGPRAPVARLVDFEDLSIDGSCYALSSICANINVTNKIGNKKFSFSYLTNETVEEESEDEEEKIQETESSVAILEYPEIISVKEKVELDCDDLSIMDTELDPKIKKKSKTPDPQK
ncbi:hypothetical protein WR25_14289 [Diploscapter pachys]|uniref:Uncharacterized protein n=1 Tax=Diploscapter pachys TaxID=2018661 RepID=A0A2A2KGQ8_9BILA|nr:hypothetical protein WR25_14289 [Diploscapter pachys]